MLAKYLQSSLRPEVYLEICLATLLLWRHPTVYYVVYLSGSL